MSGWVKSRQYFCSNDCQMNGCPGHTLALHYHGVSDTYTVTSDSRERLCADDGFMEALACLWGSK